MVIDPEWGDDLKVTVVVTGLSDPAADPRHPAEEPRDGAGGAPDETDGEVDYEELERPAYLRDRKERRVDPIAEVESEAHDSYLDLRAFLSRTDP